MEPALNHLREVLCLIDGPDRGEGLAAGMEPHGYRLLLAHNPDDAARLAIRHNPMVVVSSLGFATEAVSMIERLKMLLPQASFIISAADEGIDIPTRDSVDNRILSIIAEPWSEDEMAALLSRAFSIGDRRHEQSGVREAQIRSLLLLEDNPGDADLTHLYLRRVFPEAEVRHVLRLSEAREELRREHFDVILADLTLPDARGLDAVMKLHQEWPEAALVVLSGIDDAALEEHAFALGAQEFLFKSRLNAPLLSRAISCAWRRQQALRSLTEQANHDSLTGLLNRASFKLHFSRVMQAARRQGRAFGLLYLDLDEFKSINDELGHAIGDAVLQEVADRLRGAVRESDALVRLGGDEFAVLLNKASTREHLTQVADRIVGALGPAMQIQGHCIEIAASIGGALAPGSGETMEELIAAADAAMYRAKRERNVTIAIDGEARSMTSPGRARRRRCSSSKRMRIVGDSSRAPETKH